jgi:hypothetical protein
MNFPIETDNLEKGRTGIKSFLTIEELKNYLEKFVISPKMINDFTAKDSSYFIETSLNPGKFFLELLNKIEQKNAKI